MEEAYFDEEDDKNIEAHVFSFFMNMYGNSSNEEQDKGVKEMTEYFDLSEDEIKKYAEEYYYGNSKK